MTRMERTRVLLHEDDHIGEIELFWGCLHHLGRHRQDLVLHILASHQDGVAGRECKAARPRQLVVRSDPSVDFGRPDPLRPDLEELRGDLDKRCRAALADITGAVADFDCFVVMDLNDGRGCRRGNAVLVGKGDAPAAAPGSVFPLQGAVTLQTSLYLVKQLGARDRMLDFAGCVDLIFLEDILAANLVRIHSDCVRELIDVRLQSEVDLGVAETAIGDARRVVGIDNVVVELEMREAVRAKWTVTRLAGDEEAVLSVGAAIDEHEHLARRDNAIFAHTRFDTHLERMLHPCPAE
ncbi:hypothetical protein ACVIEO_005401 [Rhizobium leguminosarum]